MNFKEKLKPMLELEPIFINKLAGKLKPRAKIVYYVLLALCVLSALGAIVSLFRSGVSAFVINTLVTVISFVVARMFSEYLYNKD
jgi:hypothetical protein